MPWNRCQHGIGNVYALQGQHLRIDLRVFHHGGMMTFKCLNLLPRTLCRRKESLRQVHAGVRASCHIANDGDTFSLLDE